MSEETGLLDRSRREFERALQRNIKGLGYFNSPAPVMGASEKDVLIERGTMRLYHYRPLTDEIYRVPVLLVMATTNRGYIFDLTSYVLDFLPTCIARVKHVTGEPDVSLLGYCFGGVLSLLWASLHPEAGLKNLAVFTTPVDFTQMPLFASWSDQRYFDVDRLVDTLGNCPAQMLYTAFDSLRPAGRVAGNFRLLDRMWDDEFVKAHRMIDRWGSDVLPLAGAYFRDTTKKLMWNNALLHGTMDVAGRPVDLARITVPFLHVTAEHDHIVPTAASAPLIEMIGSSDKEQVTLKGGHVSLIGGPNAVRRMWPKLDDWLAEKSL